MTNCPSHQSQTTAPSKAARAILDAAEKLAQTRGYNGFSYADVAVQLGVTKASLHYHFPSKADLGRALLERYHAVFADGLARIDQASGDPCRKLERYVRLYDAVLVSDRMCLCGMFAAEYATLPQPMQEQLHGFFDANERWLTRVLQEGRSTGRFAFKERAHERARVLLGALEGAMLIARSYGDARRFRVASHHLLADLCKSSPAAATRTAARKRAEKRA